MSVDNFLIENFKSRNIAVIGDVMLDRYVYGNVARLSPEAPIPVLRAQHEKFMLGGSANVARNLVALGATATLVGAIGHDDAGETVAAELKNFGIQGQLIKTPLVPTTVKTRFIANEQQILRLDIEERLIPNDALSNAVIAEAKAAIATSNAVIISDYDKGLLSPEVLGVVLTLARDAGIPTVVDPKGRDFSRYSGATVITPNADEAALVTGIACDDDTGVEKALRALLRDVPVDAVVMTRGARGMTVLGPRNGLMEPLHIRATAREVFDVSGAGDTAAATIALCVASGVPLADSARIANAAAGLAVAKRGTAVIYPHELSNSLFSNALTSIEKKMMPRAQLLQAVRQWRSEGFRIGLTNGCFDLIHPGHIALLQKARASCDKLIVAINSDESVRRLKGISRPVQSETARSIVLAAIVDVDAVTIFDEDTPLELIADVMPDVLIKGSDYAPEQVVGADLVRAHGGTLLLVPLEEGHSTSAMISRAVRD
jgi:D-beta-D-heptose 7-phosphate kinase/D-beta-D-heptose 1-phosphate adenosyltransferase